MATTTPNYGWAVPTSTDLVKDGATAIETLGDAIDASMNTALGTKKAGMVLLNTTSFSAVASVSLPASTFTSTYNSYLINIDVTQSTSLALNYRLRASGTDASGANYNNYSNFVSTVWNGGGNIANGTSGRVVGDFDTFIVGTMKIYDPATAVPTKFAIDGNGIERFWFASGGNHTLSTAYDSITFLTSTGTITGSINCYAFNV
jgi:hypothetical protein